MSATEAWVTNTSPELARWWHPVARGAEVGAEPVRVRLLGRSWVLLRTGDGVTALEDRCPHRRAPLSAGRIEGDELVCAYHGWRFGGDGRCRAIPSMPGDRTPASADVAAPWGVVERYGLVWLASEKPVAPIIDLPGWDDDTRERVDMDVVDGRYGAALLVDNQLDVAHFPFLHAATFGSPAGQLVPTPVIERDGWAFISRSEIAISAGNDPAVLTGERPRDQHRTMTYRYQAPFSLELRLDYPVMGGSTLIWFFAQPIAEERCRFYVTLSFEQPGGFDEVELAERVKFEYQVVGEDLDLQARFEDLRLPLATGAETHVRADRPSIEYRRILADLLALPLADQPSGPVSTD